MELKGVSEYQAAQEFIIQGLIAFEKETTGTSFQPPIHHRRRLQCKTKDCGFTTDNPHDFIAHVVRETLSQTQKIDIRAEAHKTRHETVEEFLSCPVCFPRFEKVMLARGYVKGEGRKVSN